VKDIRIGDLLIGVKNRPVIVAELSGNHNHSLERALAIVDAAARAGAQALKIQTYTADTMTLNIDQGEFHIGDSSSLWQGRSLYALYQEAHTPWEWHKAIFDRCRQLGMIGFSTPFDETAVDFLESLDVPCYKVASFENADLPLIRRIAATGKPLIISTGMATLAELDETVRTAREAGCRELILLKCTSSYPASPADSNLITIPHMAKLFDCQVGLSDHTLGLGAAIAAVAIGATMIEKHFTLARSDGGVDTVFSLEPIELKQLVEQTDQAWLALGQVSYGATEPEKSSRMFRRSLYVANDMKAGDVFSRENLRIIRPGLGLAPKYFDLILGKKVAADVARGTPVDWELIG
jgi:pseudaminic acid synthase